MTDFEEATVSSWGRAHAHHNTALNKQISREEHFIIMMEERITTFRKKTKLPSSISDQVLIDTALGGKLLEIVRGATPMGGNSGGVA